MKYKIDQSIKIENSSQTTYVAIANGSSQVYSIGVTEKRLLIKLFRILNKPLIYKIFTFSFICAKLISDSKAKHVIIDQEYYGHDKDIKNYITQILQINSYCVPSIEFNNIGRSCLAHKTAYMAHIQKKSHNKVTSQEVIKTYQQISQ